jgi:hypothetical protein
MSSYAVLEAHPDLDTSADTSVATTYDDGLPSLSRCEIDPEMYRVFAYAVLGWHRRMPKAGGDMCRCGKKWLYCEYVDLADKLLWTGPAAWTTEAD